MAGAGPSRAVMGAVALLIFAGSVDTQASPKSERLIREGLVKLKAREIVAAGKLFTQAVKADPKDGKAAFYLGVSLNRAGQHGLALAAFQRMWDLKIKHRELGFEGGWAALARNQFKTAVMLLEPYVKKNPKNAKAREFLGRAYIGTGKLDQAINRLKIEPK